MHALGDWVQRAVWIARRVASIMRPSHLARDREIRRGVDVRELHFGRPWPLRLRAAVMSVVSDRSGTGEIWAVGLARNEADIIEETVRGLVAQGVDRVVVLDHASDDDTAAILRRMAPELPVTVVDDRVPAFWQSEKTTMLARAAAAAGASWIVPFDADELWFGDPGRTLAETLRAVDGNVVRATWYHYLPIELTDAPCYAARFPFRVATPSENVKVAFRANWLAHIDAGNHSVFRACAKIVDGLRIAHYSVRSPEQMLRKARGGAAAMRAAGRSLDRARRWAELEHADVSAAQGYLDEMARTNEVAYDPASGWS